MRVVSFTPLTFTGVSTFSTDFQTIMTRAVELAQIPITALQNKDSDTLQKKTLLGGLAGPAAGLSSSLAALGKTAEGKALSATTSDAKIVTATNTGATSAASYTIDSVTTVATSASERTQISYTSDQAVSSTGTVKLMVGAQSRTLMLTTNTIAGLRDQINNAGLGVTASILTAPGGNYLSLSTNSTGATTLRLVDDPDAAATNRLTSAHQGTDAVFSLNGISIQQPGNVVNSVVSGVTFTIQGASATAATITLASDRSQLSSALQDLVGNYNAVRSQLTAQVGAGAGLLTGDTIVTQLQDTLRQLSSYRSTSGGIRSLADLGVSFSNTGVASFDQPTFDNLSGTQIADAFTFVGSATAGLGGFSKRLSQYSDPIGGLIKNGQGGLEASGPNLQAPNANF